MAFAIYCGAGAVLGGLVAWLWGRASQARQRGQAERELAAAQTKAAMLEAQLNERHASAAVREQELAALRAEVQRLAAREAELVATAAKDRQSAQEKLALLDQARVALSDAFKSLSAEALRSNNQSFLQLARTSLESFQEQAKGDLSRRQQAIDELVRPVKETLTQFDNQIRSLEQARTEAYTRLTEQVGSLRQSQEQLHRETANLAKALGAPQTRGRWGELTLRRVVELAGMQRYCDFEEQVSLAGEEGRLRPDLVVRLPGGRCVAVDAKAPLNAYMEAANAADDGTRRAQLAEHARRIREHIRALSAKAYWQSLEPAPEFVILFLPGEPFYSAALEADATLIEAGVEQRVVLATPTTLIALLKAIAYGWRQEALAENAQQISELGRELYKRLADMTGHFEDLGQRLGKATESYNSAIGSLEKRVLVSARRFEELQAAGDKRVPELEPIGLAPREIEASVR